MNKNCAFDRCMSDMSLNLKIMEELEEALSELQGVAPATRYSADHPCSTSGVDSDTIAV